VIYKALSVTKRNVGRNWGIFGIINGRRPKGEWGVVDFGYGTRTKGFVEEDCVNFGFCDSRRGIFHQDDEMVVMTFGFESPPVGDLVDNDFIGGGVFCKVGDHGFFYFFFTLARIFSTVWADFGFLTFTWILMAFGAHGLGDCQFFNLSTPGASLFEWFVGKDFVWDGSGERLEFERVGVEGAFAPCGTLAGVLRLFGNVDAVSVAERVEGLLIELLGLG